MKETTGKQQKAGKTKRKTRTKTKQTKEH